MLSLLISQFLIYALAWGVGAALLREERRAVLWWAGYCLLQALGLDWMIRYAPPEGTIAPAAAAVMLAGYACADLGIDAFVHGRVRRAGLWVGAGLAGMLWQWAAVHEGWSAAWVGIGHNLCVAALLALPLVVLGPALRREFRFWGWLALAPGGLMCLFALLRTGVLILHPEDVLHAAAPGVLEELLQSTLWAAGAFNIAFLGLVLGRLVRQLHSRLDTDPLTGLISRAGLERRLAEAWAASLRHETPLTLAFIDIDDFKTINDTGGHALGDRAIQAVGQALRQQARETDAVGRWGGDEFLILMPQTTAAAAEAAVHRLRQQVRSCRLSGLLAERSLELSIGLATRSEQDRDMLALVRRADAAMYRCKQARKADPAPDGPVKA